MPPEFYCYTGLETGSENNNESIGGAGSRMPRRMPRLWVALIPVVVLLVSLTAMIIIYGADSVQTTGPWTLLASGAVALILGLASRSNRFADIMRGIGVSARQVVPSLPILLLIGTVSATWMLSGIVPLLIKIGLHILSPTMFLVISCAVSAVISVLTGSSWTTIATIGVAFMGIGTVMGFPAGWIAGAIISGAYFGDKVSPLSDTTVLASSSCGVELFGHIRYMMLTSMPSMLITLGIFAIAGFLLSHADTAAESGLLSELESTFRLTPWLLLVPAVTGVLIAMRLNTYLTLGASSLMGLAAMLIAQPQIVADIAAVADPSAADQFRVALTSLATSTQITTPSELLDSLVATGGMAGMLPTIFLVCSAMVFGGLMIGTGMLASITDALTRRLRTARSTVTATVASGLALNSCTGDQYLSIIISANIYKQMYHRNGLESRLLSRTVEDSVSVTSVLVPWNSCGLTQSAVLGVGTLAYLPYCFFNYISPLMSLFMAWADIRIHRLREHVS